PECAAAMSILAEDERVHLVTPSSFAKLLVSAQGVRFERALAEAIAGGAAERLGLVERGETTAQKPLAQVPLRLSSAEARRQLLGDVPEVEPSSVAVAREPPARVLALPEALVRNARSILEENGVLCVRAGAARTARQLGIDIASAAGEAALLVASEGDP